MGRREHSRGKRGHDDERGQASCRRHSQRRFASARTRRRSTTKATTLMSAPRTARSNRLRTVRAYLARALAKTFSRAASRPTATAPVRHGRVGRDGLSVFFRPAQRRSLVSAASLQRNRPTTDEEYYAQPTGHSRHRRRACNRRLHGRRDRQRRETPPPPRPPPPLDGG